MAFSENNNAENIEKYLLSLLPNDIDKTEGSFTQMIVGAMSVESGQLAALLDVLLQQTNIFTMSGNYLDAKAYEYDITRFKGAYATVQMTITGVDGTTIPSNTLFATNDGVQFTSQEEVTIADGTVTVQLIASEVGYEGNVLQNEITTCIDNIVGIQSFTNAVGVNGIDAEDDETLRKRIISIMQKPAASGNAAHYEQWAKTVDGIGSVKVIPVHAGPGTVKLICKSDANSVVDIAKLDEVRQYVSTQMPIGVALTVVSITNFVVNIVLACTYEPGSDATNMKLVITDAITRYLNTLNGGESIVYNKLLSELIQLEGIKDITNFTVNNGKVNIAIPNDNAAVVGTVTVT